MQVSPRVLALVLAILLAAGGVAADYFLKLASNEPVSTQSKWFWIALCAYALMAGGWIFVMRHLSFSEIGIVYSVATVLFLAMVGTLVLHETLQRHEIVGMAMAVGSILLLSRFG